MKHLYLLRHAKSSWDDSELEDRERPLAPRGQQAARRIAEHLQGEPLKGGCIAGQLELVLCSAALRTRETLAAILPVLEGDTEIRIEDALYAAGAEELLARVNELPESVVSVLLIGHNPGLQSLALSLAGSGEGLDQLREHFPTGALATLAIPTAWRSLGAGDAELEAYVVPRELH